MTDDVVALVRMWPTCIIQGGFEQWALQQADSIRFVVLFSVYKSDLLEGSKQKACIPNEICFYCGFCNGHLQVV